MSAEDQFLNSDIIATAAAVIGLCAMFTTLWQAHIARRHSRLSVRPHLDDHVYRPVNEPFRYSIVNCGLGPAIVTRSSVLIDGKEFQVGSSIDWHAFGRFAQDLPSEMQWTVMTTGTVISPGSQIDIVKWSVDIKSDSEYQHAYNTLGRIGFLVSYKSMYDEYFSIYRASVRAR